MYVIIWEYDVPAQSRERFEQDYGGDGTWAKFFAHGDGYLGTTLLKKIDGGYVTLDFWQTSHGFDRFMALNRDRYEAIDRQCESLTTAERLIGRFSD